jgi:hypothetical protein
METAGSTTPDFGTRLAHLERRNLTLSGVVAMLGVLVLVMIAWRMLPARRTLDVEQIVLRDRENHARGELAVGSDGTAALRLNDVRGKARALWRVMADGSVSMHFRDERGVSRAELAIDPAGVPSLALTGADGHTRTWLGLVEANAAGITLRDPSNTTVWRAP